MRNLLLRRSITYADDVVPGFPSRRDDGKALVPPRLRGGLPRVEDPDVPYEIAVVRPDAPHTRMRTEEVAAYVQDLGPDSVEGVLIAVGGRLVPEQLRNLLCDKTFDRLPEDVREVIRFGARWGFPVRFTSYYLSAADYLSATTRPL
jgi:hypothetical protein